MGFNLTAFAGGFAKAAVESIEKEEELASARGTAATKLMYDNYKKVTSENTKLSNELKANVLTIKTYDKDATEDELYAIATNKPVMDYVAAQIKKGEFDASTFKASNIASITKTNTKSTAIDRIRENLAIPKILKEGASPFAYADTGNVIRDFKGAAGSRAAESSARQTAAALGVSYEDLLASQDYKRPEMKADAVYNMGGIKLIKTPDQEIADAQLRLANSMKSGDEKGQREANADLLIYRSVKDTMTPEQTKFASKIADIKNRYMFGSADQRAAAKPEYDKLMSDIRAEAAAKKAGEGGATDKIPALSSLNSFTTAVVARTVSAKYGDMVKSKQIAFTEKPDGSMSIDYIGDNAQIRRDIQNTQYEAAKNALSLYTDADGVPLTKDVSAVLNGFKPVASAVPEAAPTREKPALPKSTYTGSGRQIAPAAPAAPAAGQSAIAQTRAQADAAIKQGVNRESVAKRFKETTGQDY